MIVHNKGNYIRNAAGVTLLPGSNEIDEDEWEEFSSNRIAKNLVDSGEVVALKKNAENIEENNEEPENDEGAETTKDLNADEAIELVEDTYSLSLLREWKEKEDRKTVVASIDKQVELLTEGGDGAEEDGDN